MLINNPSHQQDAVALSVQHIGKRYADINAVDNVSFAIRHREIVGLLGPNGAGKTTIINMILGVLEPSAGNIQIEGFDIRSQRASALAHTNFAAVYATLPGNLSVEENLRVFGLIYGVRHLQQRLDELLQQFDLVHFRHTKCGVLSSGEQTRVSLAKALLNNPSLLLLDEPTASIDPSAAKTIRESIRELTVKNHCGILWTSHNMYEVEAVCDRVLFLSHGRILLEGDPRTLPQQHGAATLEQLFIDIAREPLSYSQGATT